MTTKQARRRVFEIAEKVHDQESAHAAEDQLWEEVLVAISNRRCRSAALLARAALETRDLKFDRWYA